MNRRSGHKGKQVNASDVVARQKSSLIIDGYNLMHVTRFKPTGKQAGELRRCREGLLSLLVQYLSPAQYREITVVFDAMYAPSHLADQQQYQHIRVIYARHENSADDMIANLVQKHHAASQLIVVSSDHRVQNAAKRRKATAVDSDAWFDAVLEYKPDTAQDAENALGKPDLDERQMSEFVKKMNEPVLDGDEDDQSERPLIENPFPEGYFDDLEDLE